MRRRLSIEAGYRFSDYSTGFSTDTYKAGLDWAPVDMLRFRGSFQRAVRAPNVGELFSSQSVALDGSTDPCAGARPSRQRPPQAECALTGVTAAQYGNLAARTRPTSTTACSAATRIFCRKRPTRCRSASCSVRTVGDLTIAIDYFDITIEDTISSTAVATPIRTSTTASTPAIRSSAI